MKTGFFSSLLALALCVGVANAQNNVTIRGKVQNPVDTKVSIRITRGAMTPPEKITLELDKANSFVFATKVDEMARFNFSHGPANNIDVWILEPNDDVAMTFDANNFYPTLQFEGKNADKFNYYVADYLDSDVKRKWDDQLKKNRSLPLDQQYAYLDTIMGTKLAILETYKSKVSPLFYEVWKTDIKSMVNNYRFSPIYMEKRKDQKFGLYSLTAEQRKFMNDMPSQNDTTFRSDMFRDYLSMVFNLMYEETAKVSGHSGWSRQKVAGFKAAFYQDKFNELSLAQGLESNIGYAGITTEAQAEYDAFLKAYPNSAYKEPLQKTYEKMLAFAKGKPAIPFTLKNEKGEVVKLQDFKNKVVYLDFWASWCGPCIQEMKASKPVKAHFKDNQDLVFLYISIDEKVEDWRAGMEKHEVEGVNLWAEKAWQDPIAKAYNIVGIPKYYLIDGEGKFNDSAPPRASQNEGKDLIKTLEAALATLKK